MNARAAIFACALLATHATSVRADSAYRGLSCTLRSPNGGIYTVSLRVPKSGSGPCQLVSVMPTIISGPTPASSSSIPLPALVPSGPVVHTYNVVPPYGRPHPPGPGLPQALEARFSHIDLPYLGTLTTTRGDSYDWCRLLTFQKDGVIVVDANGVSKILFTDLDASSRVRVESVH